MRKKMMVLIFSCLTTVSVKAQEIHHEKCSENSTQEETNLCVVRNYEIAEHALDSVYSAVLKDISYEHEYGSSDTSEPDLNVRRALILSQKTWLKFRDAETALVKTFFEGGSMAGAVAWKYKTQLTLDRIRELGLLRKFRYSQAVPEPNWRIQ